MCNADKFYQTKMKEEIPIEKPITRMYHPFICDESLFQSSTEDRKMNNFEELTLLGRNFFICCLHLLLESDSDEDSISRTFGEITEYGKLNYQN